MIGIDSNSPLTVLMHPDQAGEVNECPIRTLLLSPDSRFDSGHPLR
jgi:hypothetical protein